MNFKPISPRPDISHLRLDCFLALTSILALAPFLVPAADWPQNGGPDASWISPETGINTDWNVHVPPVLWTYPMHDSGGYAHASIVKSTVYILDHVGSRDVLRALDLTTGEQRWESGYEDAKSPDNGFCHGYPVYDNGNIYTFSLIGNATGFNATNGTILWSRNLQKEYDGKKADWGYSGSPLVDGNQVIYVPGGRGASVVALDRNTGATLWQSGSDRAGHATPVVVTLHGVRQYIVFNGFGVVGIKADDGTQLWRHQWYTQHSCNVVAPVVMGNKVFITSGYGVGCAMLEIAGDWKVKEIWKNKELMGRTARPILDKGYLYGTDETARLICLNVETGMNVWTQEGFGGRIGDAWKEGFCTGSGGLIMVDGTLLVVSELTKSMVAVKATPNGYQELGRLKLLVDGQNLFATPSFSDGKLVVRDRKNLYCVDLSRSAVSGETRNNTWMSIRTYSYKNVPTIKEFASDDSMLRAVMGPFGSGKTTGCGPIEIVKRAMKQAPMPDGISRSRWGVVRNSYPQLRDTTIPTFHQWILELGDWKATDYDLIINKIQTEDGHPVEATIHFRALDKPQDIRNLLSLELTGAFFNEAREIALPIVNAMRGRIGRYPPKNADGSGGATWHGIWMDTNPPDIDHWFYKMFEIQRPQYCITCKDRQGGIILFENGRCPKCNAVLGVPYTKLWKQPSGRSEQAENLPFLPIGYYANLAAGQDKEFISVYVDGDYGYVSDGKAVYPQFDASKHVSKETLKADPQYPLIIGFDNTGRDQATIICQFMPWGQLRVLHEFLITDTCTRLMIKDVIRPFLVSKYYGAQLILTGDPAGVKRSDTDERTSFQEINEILKMEATPARSNSLSARFTAVESLLMRFCGKHGYGMLIDPSCMHVIRGFKGEYKMRRIQIVGKEMYTDKPEKNLVSHIHDALQYASMAVEDALTLLTPAPGLWPDRTSAPIESGGWSAFT